MSQAPIAKRNGQQAKKSRQPRKNVLAMTEEMMKKRLLYVTKEFILDARSSSAIGVLAIRGILDEKQYDALMLAGRIVKQRHALIGCNALSAKAASIFGRPSGGSGEISDAAIEFNRKKYGDIITILKNVIHPEIARRAFDDLIVRSYEPDHCDFLPVRSKMSKYFTSKHIQALRDFGDKLHCYFG